MNDLFIESLKKVNKYPEAVNKIEEFIKFYDKPHKEIGDKLVYFEDVVVKFKRLCKTICHNYELEINDLYCFFKMDKKLYTKIYSSLNKDPFDCPIHLRMNYLYANGTDITWLVNNRKPEAIVDFFEPIVHLLPKSSKKYLCKHIDSFNLTKESVMPTNGFVSRIVNKELPNKPNAKVLKSYFDKIDYNDDYEEAFLSFVHFYNLISKKYKDCKQSYAYKDLLSDVDYGVYKSFLNLDLYNWDLKNEFIKKLRVLLENDNFILSSIIQNFLTREGFYHCCDDKMSFLGSLNNYDEICDNDLYEYFPNCKFLNYRMKSFKTYVKEALREMP